MPQFSSPGPAKAHARLQFFIAVLALLAILLPAARANASTFTVNSLGDIGTGSGTSGDLRYVIGQANTASNSTVVFSVTGTITLTSTLPTITQSLTIQGPGASLLTISGSNAHQILSVNTSGSVTTSGIAFAKGYWTSVGGAAVNIQNGAVTIEGCTFSSNQSAQGGAVQNSGTGTLILSDDTFAYNSSTGQGGAVVSGSTSQLVVTGSTFIGNYSAGYGGAIWFNTGAILNSTFVFNDALSSGGALNINGSATVTQNTFYANNGEAEGCFNCTGAAIQAGGSSGATSAVNNNIFDNNNGGGIYRAGGILNASNNVYWNNIGDLNVEDDCNSCSSNSNAVSASVDPLMPLNFYGGLTKSMMLTTTSDARCAGGASLAVDANSNPLKTDQRGFPFIYGYCTNDGVDAGSVQSNYQIVTTNADSNDGVCTPTLCSLRDAIAAAESAGGGDIGFSSSLNNQTIALGSGLEISGAIGIVGPGANLLAVSGGGNSTGYGVFTVDSGTQAVLYGMTITNGGAENGGGINNAGNLLVNASVISASQAGTEGGGIENTGTLELLGSTVTGNFSGHYGAGISNNGGSLTLIESTVSGNDGVLEAGGLLNKNGTVNSVNSTISGNFTGLSGAGIFTVGGTLSFANSVVTGNNLGTPGSPGNYDDVNYSSGTINDLGGNVWGYTNTSSSTPPSSAGTLAALGYYGSSAVPTILPFPGSPAICASLVANLRPDIQTDERGFPNYNTTYAGFSSSSPCVDAGAVQTNYTAVKFVQEPTDTAVNALISPAPTVELVETNPNTNLTDIPSIAMPIALTYSGGASAINGTLTQPASTGVATYGDLVPNTSLHDVTLATSVPVTTAGSGTTLTATSSQFNVVGPLAGYAVTAPATAFDGTAFNFTLAAVDANGSELLGATDPVMFSSTDGAAVLLGTSNLTGPSGTFSATLNTSGSQTITVTDANNSLIMGTSNTIAASGPATQVEVTGYPTPVFQGASATGTITALDASGFPATSFNGLATLTTSDTQAAVDSTITLVNGVGTFTATFITVGSQSITASSTGLTSIPETGINVTAPPGYVVNTTLDDSPAVAANCPIGGSAATCTLRDAVAAVATAGTGEITFDSTVFLASNSATANTIYLSHGTIALPSNAFLNGLTSGGSNLVTIDGSGAAGIFSVAVGNTDETLANLNFAHGNNASGSVVANGGTLTVSNCTFSNNTGAAIRGQDTNAKVSVIGSTFTGNSATTGRSNGAAINSTGSATIVNSSFLNNSASGQGAAVFATGSSLTVTGSSFSGNSALLAGGALNCSTSNPTIIVNSTFTGNSAIESNGGAIITGSNLKIYSSTIAGNSSKDQGGGIYLSGGSSKLTLTLSIVAGNSAPSWADIYATGYTDGGGNLASTNSGATSTINPQLAPLGNYGGPTQTMLPLPGSSAICAGRLANEQGASLTADQRGLPFNPVCPSGFVDSGAVQTNYALSFLNNMPSSVPGDRPIAPAPLVGLTESGVTVNAATSSVAMTDSDNVLAGTDSAALSAGTATFSNLIVPAPETSDYLIARLSLNSTLTPPLTITAQSPSFQVMAGPAVLISPTADSTLGSSATFTWTTGVGVTDYFFVLGTTGITASDLYSSGSTLATSANVSGIPSNGVNVYASLYSKIGGTWLVNRYTFTETGTPAAAVLTTPTPSNVLPGSSVAFTWTTGSGPTAYYLDLGTTGPGSDDLYNSGTVTTTTVTANALPTYGDTIYATLHSKIDGVWQATNYTYTEAGSTSPAVISSPTAGTLLSGTVTFNWNLVPGVNDYIFKLGTAGVGSSNLYLSGQSMATTATVNDIPAFGFTVYATLLSRINGAWQTTSVTYTEAGTASPATLTSPTLGSALGSSATFTWSTGNGTTAYYFTLGTSGPSSSDLYNSGSTTATSAGVSAIPVNGATVYATLYSKLNEVWQTEHYTFTESGTP